MLFVLGLKQSLEMQELVWCLGGDKFCGVCLALRYDCDVVLRLAAAAAISVIVACEVQERDFSLLKGS